MNETTVMRSIMGVALGSYYSPHAEGARGTPHAVDVRRLCWAFKNNREPPNPAEAVNHPFHPSHVQRLIDHTNAISYATEIVDHWHGEIWQQLGWAEEEPFIVPIPSGPVTPTTIETARFPTRQWAMALDPILGPAKVVVVNARAAQTSKSRGANRERWNNLRSAWELVDSISRNDSILLVDDLVTGGDHVAAMDAALGFPPSIAVLSLAMTESRHIKDAGRFRRFRVEYDPADLSKHATMTRLPLLGDDDAHQ